MPARRPSRPGVFFVLRPSEWIRDRDRHRDPDRPDHPARRVPAPARDGAEFLLESVEQGRLGPLLLLGCGARLVAFEDAETRRAARPWSATSATTSSRSSNRPCRFPTRGPTSREPLRRRRHARPLRPSPRHRRGSRRRSRRRGRGSASRPLAPRRPRAPASGPLVLPPRTRPSTSDASPAAKEYIRAGDAFQIVVAQRAHRPTSASPVALYRALRRVNPSPVPLSARARRPRARRLLSGDGREVEGLARERQPDRRHDPRPARATQERLLASEKDRAEHVMLVDLGRNDLSRVCRAGTVHVERFLDAERFSHVTHLVSEVGGSCAGRAISSFDLLRAHASRRARSPARRRYGRCRSSPSSRATAAGPTRERSGTPSAGGTLDTCIAIRTLVLRDGVAICRPAAASSPTPIRPPSTRSASTSWRRSKRRSTWRRRRMTRIAHPAGRQLRQLHVQPGAPASRSSARR